MAGTTTLTQDQDRALRTLNADGVLTIEQADAVRAALGATNQVSPGATMRHWLPEIHGYLGGGLILGGAALLVGGLVSSSSDCPRWLRFRWRWGRGPPPGQPGTFDPVFGKA